MTALLSLCKLVCNSLSFPASVSGVWQLDKCMYLTEIGVLATLMAEISFSKSTYVSFFFLFSLQCIKNCLHINVRNGLAPSFSISIMQIISFQDNHSQKQHLGQATGGLTQGNVTADQPESQVHVKSVSFIYLFIYDYFFPAKQWDSSDSFSRSSLFVSATSFVLFSVSSGECERK